MKKVLGIGGFFFRANDPNALAEWYETHLGINFGGETYAAFSSIENEKSSTAFSIFPADTKYFAPSEKQFMINLRVENLPGLVDDLRAANVYVFDEIVDGEYGKFAWILDPENNKIELWEPPE